MPRYFFHFSDGKSTFTDDIGTDLAGLGNAKKLAISQMRDWKSKQSAGEIREWSNWKMIVVDANGKIVLEVGFDLTPRPSRH